MPIGLEPCDCWCICRFVLDLLVTDWDLLCGSIEAERMLPTLGYEAVAC